MRSQFAQDIPQWSEFVRQAADLAGCAYFDMSDDFQSRLSDAEAFLTGTVGEPIARQ